MGVSAGASHGTRLVAAYGEKLCIDAFVSISNPYNLSRLTFQFSNSYSGVLISKFLTWNYKQLYSYHQNNPNFQSIMKKRNYEVNVI